MRPGLLLAALVLSILTAGCAAQEDPTGATAPAPGSETLDLHCAGHGGAIASFEGAESGRCWHHMGHHLYFLPEARLLHRFNGTAFVVEQTFTPPLDGFGVMVDVSLDGKDWSLVADVGYEPNDADRQAVPVAADVSAVPFRFLRVHVPPTPNEGLSGYLDGSWFSLDVSEPPAPLPEPAPRRSSDCAADGVLESFFAEHPCWFGGYDEVDAATAGSGPDTAHTSPMGAGASYYESPSFVHTHYLGLSPGGAMQATVDYRPWRTTQEPLCAATSSRTAVHLPTTALILVQASHDGTVWADVQRVYSYVTGPSSLEATIPEGTRFVRFSTGQGPGIAEGPCYHSNTFLVDSRLEVTPA